MPPRPVSASCSASWRGRRGPCPSSTGPNPSRSAADSPTPSSIGPTPSIGPARPTRRRPGRSTRPPASLRYCSSLTTSRPIRMLPRRRRSGGCMPSGRRRKFSRRSGRGGRRLRGRSGKIWRRARPTWKRREMKTRRRRRRNKKTLHRRPRKKWRRTKRKRRKRPTYLFRRSPLQLALPHWHRLLQSPSRSQRPRKRREPRLDWMALRPPRTQEMTKMMMMPPKMMEMCSYPGRSSRRQPESTDRPWRLTMRLVLLRWFRRSFPNHFRLQLRHLPQLLPHLPPPPQSPNPAGRGSELERRRRAAVREAGAKCPRRPWPTPRN
mmetsp:Transcript_5432/g.13009  ORF Transcript_5432/g.13009 Transcript_5432/m.13009 type:complete len:322 (-) Transcript_5432:163-1128(-)